MTKTSEIRLLLHQAMIVADPHRISPRNEQDMRELLKKVALVAGDLLEERDQLGRRLRRSAKRTYPGILALERCDSPGSPLV
jgi:hypothetical protein